MFVEPVITSPSPFSYTYQIGNQTQNRLPTARVVGGSDSEPGNNLEKPKGNPERSMLWKMLVVAKASAMNSMGTRLQDEEKIYSDFCFQETFTHLFTHTKGEKRSDSSRQIKVHREPY